MKLFRLYTILVIVLLVFVAGLVLAQDATMEPTAAATLPPSMATALVPCGEGVTGPCDFIATKAEDIAGVWKQYLQGPFFNAPGEVAYIRFNADGTLSLADSIENTAKPFQNYPTGTFKFEGQNWSTPLILNDGVQAPCTLETDAYQVRVMMYGDKPVALQFVFISDGCAGRISDYSQPLIWVSN